MTKQTPDEIKAGLRHLLTLARGSESSSLSVFRMANARVVDYLDLHADFFLGSGSKSVRDEYGFCSYCGGHKDDRDAHTYPWTAPDGSTFCCPSHWIKKNWTPSGPGIAEGKCPSCGAEIPEEIPEGPRRVRA